MHQGVTWMAALLCAAASSALADTTNVCALVRDRYAAQILAGDWSEGASPGLASAPASASTSPSELLRTQRTDGAWDDVPYDSPTRGGWPPAEHLRRLLVLARAEHDPQPPATDDVLAAAVRRGLAFWVRSDPHSDNWWWQTIGTQQVLGPVLALSRSDLLAHAPETWRAACRQMSRSHVDRMTGANLVWEAGNLLILGALTDDPDLMARMSALVAAQIHLGTDEGIQPDFSFLQHGPQLNAGNYGLSFVASAASDALLLQGTPVAIPADRIRILGRFEANFQEWTVWGRDLDLSSCGRQLDLPDAQTRKAQSIAAAGLLLAELTPAEAPHWKHFADRTAGALAPRAFAPIGDRFYWRSDFLVHRPGRWYFSVKMFSPRVLRTETWVNRENRRGYHLSDGMVQLLVRGDEYENIQPVWNWRMLPGVTFKRTDAPFPSGEPAAERFNPRRFVGGLALAPIGVAALDLQKEDVSAQKAYFCFPDGVVCLGTKITCPSSPTYTDVNQCLQKGPVLPIGPHALWHDGVAYVNLDSSPWSHSAGPQTGSWSDLREDTELKGPVTKPVFNLWIDHGTAPTDGHYAYAILPSTTPEAARFWLRHPRLRVVTNGTVQSVADVAHSQIAAVFHGPGTVPGIGAIPTFSVDRPCIVLARIPSPAHTLFAVADPSQTLKQVRITPLGQAPIVVLLPQGPLAGSTAVATE